MISDAIIRTITRWLPTLDEARLREVEDFVLAKAIEQQDSAPADTVVLDDGFRSAAERARGKRHNGVIERLSKSECAATPPAFRDVLLDIARSAHRRAA